MTNPVYQRLLEEEAQLSDRITKIHEFFTSATFDGLEPVDQGLLQNQVMHMTRYRAVLRTRIKRFPDEDIVA